jgi:hypothetical protein
MAMLAVDVAAGRSPQAERLSNRPVANSIVFIPAPDFRAGTPSIASSRPNAMTALTYNAC